MNEKSPPVDSDIYDFHMSTWTPDTLPMGRLAEYLDRLSTLFGHEAHVHFVKVRKGSAVPEIRVERQSADAVRGHLALVRNHAAPQEALKAMHGLNRLLQEDRASAYLKHKGGARVLNFPGIKTPLAEEAVVHESGELTGTVIRVGGKDDSVPLWLSTGDGTVYKCNTSRALARDLAHHLFSEPVRVAGTGKWRRTDERKWELVEFKVKSWESLVQTPLPGLVSELRGVSGSGWNEMTDPHGVLRDLRED